VVQNFTLGCLPAWGLWSPHPSPPPPQQEEVWGLRSVYSLNSPLIGHLWLWHGERFRVPIFIQSQTKFGHNEPAPTSAPSTGCPC
jgi:hypothetical protein